MRKLQASNFSADNWSEFGDLELRVATRKESRLGFVRPQSTILKLEWLDRFKASLFVVDREILMILILWFNELGNVLLFFLIYMCMAIYLLMDSVIICQCEPPDFSA